MSKLTQEHDLPFTMNELREVFILDTKTGALYNRNFRSSNSRADQEAGCLSVGYVGGPRWVIRFKGRLWNRARLNWFYLYGYTPHEVDHINRKPWDDRPENLREATHAQNIANQYRRPRNGLPKGVYSNTCNSKPFRSVIQLGKKVKTLGYFDDTESAATAYRKTAKQLWGEHSCQ
jgi:hypothetical protein